MILARSDRPQMTHFDTDLPLWRLVVRASALRSRAEPVRQVNDGAAECGEVRVANLGNIALEPFARGSTSRKIPNCQYVVLRCTVMREIW